MATQVVWHGTYQESVELLHAVSRHCACEFGPGGVQLAMCESHRMLGESQRVLDGLLFARCMADRLRREEFGSVQALSGSAPRPSGWRRRRQA
jgi:hypothetical protein